MVDDSCDEAQICINTWKQEDESLDSYSITINPTLDCNMHCWYCYEKHDHTRTMSRDVLQRILKLIDVKLSNSRIQSVHLSFFGGEPLIQFHRIVQPIIDFAYSRCESAQKQLSIGFVTNGYLLSPGIIKYLISKKCPTHFQITIDGNMQTHNATRVTTSGKGSYTKILKNIGMIVPAKNIGVTLRLNYTRTSIDTFLDVAYDLPSYIKDSSNPICIDLQRIWQDDRSADGDFDSHIEKVRRAFERNGYVVSDEKEVSKYRCYADRDNHIVINYDGTIFHCTARDFTHELSEGILSDSGNIILNERAAQRKQLKWGNAVCQKCTIFPICHGKCSQQKLETSGTRGCIAGYGQKQIASIVSRRVNMLIDRLKSAQTIHN
jgi:uncharacterized protein